MNALDAGPGYVELQVTTHFSFLRGASSPEELFAAASGLGMSALGVVDRHSVAGIVRAWDAEKVTGVRSIVGSRLDLVDGTALLIYPTDKAAYGRMCRLLSVGKARAGKGACHLDWSDIEDWNEGLIALLCPRPRRCCDRGGARPHVRHLRRPFVHGPVVPPPPPRCDPPPRPRRNGCHRPRLDRGDW